MTGAAPRETVYVHATALLVAEAGVLVRGPSGSGKSRLTRLLIAEARRRGLFGRLVGDDRVALAACNGRIVARGHPAIAGRLEHRGEGIATVAYADACVVRVIVDLEPDAAPRLPTFEERHVPIQDVTVPRIVLRAGLADLDVASVLDRILAGAAP